MLVRVLTGSVPVRLSFAPRPEFGQVPTQLEPVGDELRVFGSNDPMALIAPGRDLAASSTTAGTTRHTPQWTWPRPAARSTLRAAPGRQRTTGADHERRRRPGPAGRVRTRVARLVEHAAPADAGPASWCCAAR